MARARTLARLLPSLLLLATAALPYGRAGSVRTLEGETHTGNVSIGSGGVLTITATVGGATTQVDPDRLLLAVFQDGARAKPADPRGALLIDGTFVQGRVTSEREGAQYRIEGARSFRVEAAQIARLLFRQIPTTPDEHAPRNTGVLLANGDFAAGTITRLEKDRVEIASLLFGPQTFRLPDEAAGVVLAPARPEPTAFEIATVDGSLFRATRWQLENDQIALETPLLGKVKVTIADLDRIRSGEGRFQSLALASPPKIQGLPGLDLSRAFRAVTSAADPAPPVLGRRADNALILAAGTSVTYPVPAGMNFLTTEVAVPDDAPPGTRITFVIVADGQVAHRSPAQPAGIRPTPVKVKFGNARSLVLYCEPVGPATPGAVGVWTEPVLLKR